jgi:hypothetical protein
VEHRFDNQRQEQCDDRDNDDQLLGGEGGMRHFAR